MRIYKSKEFNKWAKKIGIVDAVLLSAINEMNSGLYEANLGGGVYKKRMACGKKGKRGGARVIIAFLLETKAFFVYGFAKNKMGNITNRDAEALKELVAIYLNFSDKEIDTAVKVGELIEVKDEKINTKSCS